jgi:hypothetical protein
MGTGLWLGQSQGQADQTTVSPVTLLRVPHGGIQPQALLDAQGVLHLIYFQGDPQHGDIFYVRSKEGKQFPSPLRVNSQPGSAMAVGNIRGAHLALGKGGRVHVAWMGSNQATPRGPVEAAPMLYTRLEDSGQAFAPQRNLIQKAVGLDGGGSVAADRQGNVYVTWHAPEPGSRGEEHRCVWVTRSTDEGRTFAQEQRANPEPTGACGCCGMRAFADRQGTLFLLYRSAREMIHRDMYLLVSKDQGASFQCAKLHPWEVRACPMSSMAFTEAAAGSVAAWETAGQVYCCRLDPATEKPTPPVAAPGNGQGRKHPVVAVNAAGEMILVWTEGMGWNRGGSVAWQVFDKAGRPTKQWGRQEGVPPWSLVAVFAQPNGNFTILY